MDTNMWCPDKGNLIAGGPQILEETSDTILEFMVGHNTTPKKRFVR